MTSEDKTEIIIEKDFKAHFPNPCLGDLLTQTGPLYGPRIIEHDFAFPIDFLDIIVKHHIGGYV